MVVDTQYYDLLGVAPTATDRELRVAYLQKAKILHPDKNRDDPHATAKFQQLNHAYEVLKDPEKRKIYDKYGPNGPSQGPQDFDDDIFSHLFPFTSHKSNRRRRTDDIRHVLRVNLEDLYNGKEMTLKVTRSIICKACNGQGTSDGKAPSQCLECHGTGQKVHETQMGPMITRQIIPCPVCHGSGEVINSSDACKMCNGHKVVDEEKEIKVQIRPGMENGEKITFQGLSDEAPNCDTGDLIVIIQEREHSLFTRKGDNLLIHQKISLSESLLGTKFTIKHLDNRQLIVSTPENQVIKPGSVKVIDGEGMPKQRNQFEHGDLFIIFDVQFPSVTQLTPNLRDALFAAIPPLNKTDAINSIDDNVRNVTMTESSLNEFQSGKNSKKHQREDYRHEAYQQDNDQNEGIGCPTM